MNKDVIYIEPEEDITDILTNIKGAKHKIIALVPPKKSSVLRSAVNFKLISKTAKQSNKSVVLVTADEALLKLAAAVKMPTAKTLQSKPKLPTDLDAEEFGSEKEDDEAEAEKADSDATAKDDDVIDEGEEQKIPVKVKSSSKKDDAKKAGAAAATTVATKPRKKAESIEIDLDEEEDAKSGKGKKKNTKIPPDFKKIAVPIIIVLIVGLLIGGFLFWANVIAPEAKIKVNVRTSSQNFAEQVNFTTDAQKANPEGGIFLLEEKSIKKSVSADFVPSGEINKGEKAKGTVTVTRPAGVVMSEDGDNNFSIPSGTKFTINGMDYVTTAGGSVNIPFDKNNPDLNQFTRECHGGPFHPTCTFITKKDYSSGAIPVVAVEPGEKYNIDAANSGWSININTSKKYSISSNAMTGGTDKIVKVVTDDDVQDASDGLMMSGESTARNELIDMYSKEFIIIKDSLKADGGKVSSSPAVDQEVPEGVTPKVIKEVTYKIYVIDRVAINNYITKTVKENLGDNTQIIYSTGVAFSEGDEDKARIESYREDAKTGKLKSTIKTGPEVTEQMVADKTLGKKVGEVQTMLKSINGVSEVKVDTSYFFVTRIPQDINKVKIEINLEQ